MRRVLPFLLLAGAAHAHSLPVPRVATVAVSLDGARVTLDHSISAEKSDELRRLYDRDRSGGLDAAERSLLERYLRIVALRPHSLELDGVRVALTETSARFVIPARGELHASLVLRAAWKPLAKGSHAVALRDRDAAVTVGFGERLAAAPGAVARADLTRNEPVLAVAFQAL